VENQNEDSIRIGCVVLCGGKGTRLGMDKTQLLFQGQTFLERVVNQVSQVCAPIVLVGDTDFAKHNLPSDVILESDEQEGRGPLEGIRVGLKALSSQVDLAFVTSCDVPLIEPNLIKHLHDQLGERQAIVPVSEKRVFGMTAIYQTELHIQIAERISAGQLRVSELAKAFNAVQPDVESLRQCDSKLDSMTNVNSIEDYRQLLDRFDLEMPPEIAKRLEQ
jgi:molybdopterin-guanine dinucleotide biosynthesis protein A